MRVAVGVIGGLLAVGMASGSAPASPRAAGPDLAVTSVVAPPGAAAVVDVRDAVAIRGNVRRTTVAYFLSRDRARGRGDVRLRGGRVATARARSGRARLRVPGLSPRGALYLLACADPANRVRERDERNNCRAARRKVVVLGPHLPRPLHVNELLDDPRGAAAWIGEDGGTLAVTAADGSRVTLAVPAGALGRPEWITMTPLRAVDGLPAPARVLGAVRIGPSGLRLSAAATLTVEPVAPAPAAELLPFATDDGRDLRAYPTLPGAGVRLPVLHFSSYGALRLGPSAVDVVLRFQPSSRVAWAESIIGRAIRDARVKGTGTSYLQAAGVAFYVIGNEHVRPLLDAARDTQSRLAAIQAYVSWRRQVELLLGQDNGDRQLEALMAELTAKVPPILRALVEPELQRCERSEDPFAARVALSLARLVSSWGIDIDEPAITERALRCFRFELTLTSQTEWEVDAFAHATAGVRAIVVAQIPQAPEDLSAGPLESTGWTVRLVDPLAGAGCSVHEPEYRFDRPLVWVRALERTSPDASSLALDLDPGGDMLSLAMQCPDVITPRRESSVYGLVFRHAHAAEGITPDRFRITGWAQVPGSVWAVERRYEQARDEGDWSWSESTRLFLRHAPTRAGG